MAQYPFNIDGSTEEGQSEILRLWSRAELNMSTAIFILKLTTAEFVQLARRHGVSPPSEEALDKRVKELEARVRPQLRKRKRDHIERELSEIQKSISETLDRLASVALEAQTYGQVEANQSYSVIHARLRGALDEIVFNRERFAEARLLESTDDAEFEYTDASLRVLRGLDRIAPRPDYYLVGDFNHVHPVTEHDILWSWSQGFLATSTAVEMLNLEEGDTIDEIARQLVIPLPREEALLPIVAAAMLGDEPVNGDTTFTVRRRIRDGRLKSYFRTDVEARRAFEDELRRQ
ncbi:hypothetical protein ELI33_17160 [Rhizobium ruizarguesonis]|uniref:hypothetical protein n=1 Tax=Rhizobium ruizarguesonis TaxID=2081791 RepID=UPI001031B29B|nr:hypothetical protein [Rhizobium ruizarguesonis]TAV38817.1 hypothetical protein ELI33_17160 [Rhizobium ruizarguesonis]